LELSEASLNGFLEIETESQDFSTKAAQREKAQRTNFFPL
jgi:hypothetical protein